MPTNRDRGEGNRRRKDRLAQLKKGPGIFRYVGGGFSLETIPQPLLRGRKEPLLDGNGMPVLDSSGRQMFQLAGSPVTDMEGRPVLGGPPKLVKKPIDPWVIWGVSFPKGEPVEVKSASLALKLRGMDFFEELAAIKVEEESEQQPEPEKAEAAPVEAPVVLEEPKKRGRKAKAEA